MARLSIDDMRALPDYATLYRWNVLFVSLPLIGLAGAPALNEINNRCETAELPKMTNEKIEIAQKGHKVRQPGIGTYSGTLTLTFTETVDNAIHLFIKAWRELLWGTRSGSAFSKENSEATILMNRLDSEDNEIWFYKLAGVFLEDYDLGTLESNTSDVMRPSMILSYDFFTDGPL